MAESIGLVKRWMTLYNRRMTKCQRVQKLSKFKPKTSKKIDGEVFKARKK
jgi:hypothetical protein